MLSEFQALRPKERSIFPDDGDYLLQAQMMNAGVGVARNKLYRWNGLKRGQSEFCIFQFTISGCGELIHRGRVFSVPPGSAMLLRVPEDHEYRYPTGALQPWKFLYVSLRGSEVMRLWLLAARMGGPVLRIEEGSEVLVAALEMFRYVADSKRLDSLRTSVLAYELAVRVLGLVRNGTADPRGAGGQQSRPKAVAAAIRYGLEHLDQPIGVEQMARAAGLSRFHFSREFRRSEQISPGRFLLWQRLRKAAELLLESDQPVAEVARQCGFSDVSYFGRAFARHYSLTPLAFRKSGVY